MSATTDITALLADTDAMSIGQRLLDLIKELSIRDDDLAEGWLGEDTPLGHLESSLGRFLVMRLGHGEAELVRSYLLDGEDLAYCLNHRLRMIEAEDVLRRALADADA